eukprot:scaffold167753_cov37-Tisochrysis_lutea.AAC.1
MIIQQKHVLGWSNRDLSLKGEAPPEVLRAGPRRRLACFLGRPLGVCREVWEGNSIASPQDTGYPRFVP